MARPYPALRTTASIGTAAALLAGAALGAAPAATARPAAAAVAASAPGLGFYDIPGSGGITLKGNVFTAAGAQPGERHPLIVLPTSWPAAGRVPRPGPAARRLRLCGGQLHLAGLLALRRRHRGRGPAGHRLTLVIDTVDPLYIEHDPAGPQLTFSSPRADPSYVSVPLREK